jgi:hypothetical protein
MISVSIYFTVYGSGTDDYHCRVLPKRERSSLAWALQNLTRMTDRQMIANRDGKRQTAV